MKADLSTTIGGQPMLVIRKFLRQAVNSSWGISYVRRFFEIDEGEAEELVAGLARKGYIKRSANLIGVSWWEVSAGGKRIAVASAAKKISRDAADRIISSLLQRAREVNSRNDYLFRVRRITAFGSFAEGDSAIDDIDVQVELEPKEGDEEERRGRLEKKVAEEKAAGRIFATRGEESGWGELEVLLHLKSRSRYLSFIQIPAEWRKSMPGKILFDVDG